jgi:hypothetical protein
MAVMGRGARTAESRAVAARSGASAFEAFAERYVARLRPAERAAALIALKNVAREAQAVERRRLCTDPRYFTAAVAATQDEIVRYQNGRRRGATREPRSGAARTARIASHLASRLRATRGHPSV